MATHTKNASDSLNPLGGGRQDELAQQVRVSRADIAYTDDGSQVTIGDFPAGAIIESVTVNTTTAFDSGTSDVVSVGTDGDPDLTVNDEDIQAAGVVSATVLDAGREIATADTIVAAYVSAGTAPTAGAAEVLVKWIPPTA